LSSNVKLIVAENDDSKITGSEEIPSEILIVQNPFKKSPRTFTQQDPLQSMSCSLFTCFSCDLCEERLPGCFLNRFSERNLSISLSNSHCKRFNDYLSLEARASS
jgi:hypothetical protein